MSDDTSAKTGRRDAGKPASLLHRTDLGISIVLLLICAALYYETATWETVPESLSQNIPPTFFPRIVLFCIALMALLLPVEAYFKKKGGVNLDDDRSDRVAPITYLTALLLITIVLAAQWLGTFLTMVLACFALPLLWGERRWLILIPFAILFPLLVRVIFVNALNVHFLPGLLEPLLG